MNDEREIGLAMSVDLKKARIRLFKTLLHSLGEPDYIYILINPKKKIVAIKALAAADSKKYACRINRRWMFTDNSVELYSHGFVQKLCETVQVSGDATYQLAARVIPEERLAVMSLMTMRRETPELKQEVQL